MAEPGAVPGVDPSQASSPDELATCLDGLRRRRGLSYEAMEKAAAKLPPRSGRSRLDPLPKSTVGEIVTGRRLPTKGKLLTFLAVCEVAPADLAQWLAAWERASTAHLARPVGAVRVRDARPRLLGVHAAISVPGVPDDVPPQYVLRDVDAAEFGIRARVKAAVQEGGFVLLVGGSSVGKTRCAFEAVKTLLPDWWLVHPAGSAEVAALAAAPTPQTVVWLDELQRYLDGEHGLTDAVVRALLNAPHPAVIIGTLWPGRYASYVAVPEPGAADAHGRERAVLDLAAVVRIAPEFSAAEQGRARAAAAQLAVALEVAGYGLTQTLAAAPQLVARWEGAETDAPYAWAVLTAALDAARFGARTPLSADFLRAAAPGYCTSRQQAEAPANWLEQALAYATEELHGAVAALSPAGLGMGQVAGYTAADYLIQHASRERLYARLPASTWDAILAHVRDPADTAQLADSARSRLLYGCAIPLYRHAADAGDGNAAQELAYLLAGRGDLDELRARADGGDQYAAQELAKPLAGWGDVDDGPAVYRLPVQGLRARADAGDGNAAWELAGRLTGRGDLGGLRARADVGDRNASWALAYLLAGRGDLDELRARADAGDQYAAVRLAQLLAGHGNLEGAVEVLRARAGAGDKRAAWLADLLTGRGDLDGLRFWADLGGGEAAWVLAGRGDLDQLRARADAGDQYASDRLPGLLLEQGRGAEADRLYRFGLNPDGSIACA